MKTRKWTKEAIFEEAKKFKTRSEWNKNSQSSYVLATKRGFLEEACSHMVAGKKGKLKWTKEAIFEEAKKFKTRSEWQEKSPSSYNRAIKIDCLKEASFHMLRPTVHNKKWTKETVIEEAKKFENKKEWQEKSGGSWLAAYRNEWIAESSFHMSKFRAARSGENELLNIVRKHYPNAKNKMFINHFNEFSFKRLEIDIFIPELNKGIEFDGTYWHSLKMLKRNRKNWKSEEIENYHEIKDLFFKKNGIEIMHVLENAWNLSKDDWIKAILIFIEVN